MRFLIAFLVEMMLTFVIFPTPAFREISVNERTLNPVDNLDNNIQERTTDMSENAIY